MLSRHPYVVAAAMLTGLLAACSDENTANQVPPEPRMVTVQTIVATPTTVPNSIELSGRAHAYAEAEIRPQVTGIIQKRLFTEGDPVEAGQALYQIDPAEYDSAVLSAKAALANAEAGAVAARETARRYERLASIKAVSQQEFDLADASAKQAEANIDLQRAAVSRAQIDLSRTKIRSPIAGQIGRSGVTPGALVTQNQAAPLATVVQLDPIYIDLTVSSARMVTIRQQLAAGEVASSNSTVPVRVGFENGSVHEHLGQLQFSEVSVDESSGTVAVRAVVPNPDGLILPGMFLRASFSASQSEDVIVVPQSLVGRTTKGDPTILVVTPDSKIEERSVTIDGTSGNSWIVRAGLNSGDLIASSNLQNIRPGMTVNAISAAQQHTQNEPVPTEIRGDVE